MNREAAAEYKKRHEELTISLQQIGSYLMSGAASDEDRYKLTRVIQIVQQYKPAREMPVEEVKKLSALQKFLKIFSSHLRAEPVTSSGNELNTSLVQDHISSTISTLRRLRYLDGTISDDRPSHEHEVLSQNREGATVVRTEQFDTSLTLDYQQDEWGLSRICLDGIQNHLPRDAKGSRVWVQFLVNGEWVGPHEANLDPSLVAQVRFVDDGVGYDPANLKLFYSTKSGEVDSAGQFGEGMKMLAAASLREGLTPVFESQDWSARPFAKKIKVADTRNAQSKDVEQLSFDVEYVDAQPLIGSRTIFETPTQDFIDLCIGMHSSVLELREDYRPLYSSEHGDIVDKTPGSIFIKRIKVQELPTIFSYNFNHLKTNRDRNIVTQQYELEASIHRIIGGINNEALIKSFLKEAIKNTEAIETRIDYNIHPAFPDLWKEAFYETFGNDASLDTGKTFHEDHKNLIERRQTYSSGLFNFLLKCGIRTDAEIVPPFIQKTISTSLTEGVGQEAWGAERIVIDAFQNHLSEDSGGSRVYLRFQTTDGVWHDYSEFERFNDDEIESFRIGDDGRGYDHELLGIIGSTKTEGDASGKYGEGLKMLSLAALRCGYEMYFTSRDWTAEPQFEDILIDGKKFRRLVFDTKTYTDKSVVGKIRECWYEESSTVFVKPRGEILSALRNLSHLAITSEQGKVEDRSDRCELLSLNPPARIYVRKLLIPGDHHSLFSYHFPKFDIKNRDRNAISSEDLAHEIGGFWSQARSVKAVMALLSSAKRHCESSDSAHSVLRINRDITMTPLEFQGKIIPNDMAIWKEAFENLYGTDVTIRDVESQDFDAIHQNAHVGLDTVTVPRNIYLALSNAGIPTYETVLSEMTDQTIVPDEQVTERERTIISELLKFDRLLPNNISAEIKIGESKYAGQKVAPAFARQPSSGREPMILFNRAALSLPFDHILDIYIHEKAHINTKGATDASSGFRNYLTAAYAIIAPYALDYIQRLEEDK